MDISGAAARPPDRIGKQSWVVLAILTTALGIAYVDRYVLAMLIEPIKADLGFSDSQIGLVTGFAFSAFYALFGLLIARIADRRGVRLVILMSLVVWSVMTALCGAAQNFFHMLAARFGVGAGEAGVTPASHATLARLFPPERRSLALAIYSAGGPVGIMVALFASGYLEQWLGWRWTFVVMGVPGLLLAVVVGAKMRLFPEAKIDTGAHDAETAFGAIARLLRNPAFVSVNLILAGIMFLGLGLAQWIPAYFERSFAVPRAELGLALAITQGCSMTVGVVLGGFIADALAMRDRRWRDYYIVITTVLAAPLMLSVFAAGSSASGFALLGVATFITALPGGALWASVQDAAPEEHRSMGAAFTMMVSFILGIGIGPFIVGLVSDALSTEEGIHSLRSALMLTGSATVVLLIVPIAMLLRRPRPA